MKEEFITLATRVITGEATIKDEEELQAQMQHSPALAELYQELLLSWNEAGKLEQTDFAAQDWQRLNLRIENDKAGKSVSWNKWGIAASIMLVAAVSFFLLRNGGNEQVFAEAADMELVLDDNSVVTLKKGSTIHYASDFKNNRQLKLEGEAYFKVTKDASHPFSVKTGETVTTVLGTAFLLNNREAGKVVLKVKEGKVRFENKEAGEQVLVAGEAAGFESGKISRLPVVNENDFAMVTRELHYNNAEISKVLSDVAYLYNLTLDTTGLSGDVNVFTGAILKQHTPQDAAERIQATTGITITIQGNNWIVKGGRK